MDLLEDNKKKNNKTPAQKVVLALLIFSIVLCIIIGIAMAFLSTQKENKPYSVLMNGETVNTITNESGQYYISLKSICNQLGYNYYNGEFKIAEEDKSKGYIDNGTNIIQFFTNSQKIYKTAEDSNTDYEYYNLDNKILTSGDNLYIAIYDLDVALNLILSYSEKNNQTTILSPETWISQKATSFKENGVTISNTPENMKALAYGYVVVSKDNKYGVINLNGDELIGNKYNSITFSEYTGQFIVSNTSNQFGIISKDGLAKINLQYDSLEIINYNPLLYKVKKLQKYGVMKEDGTIVNDIVYDSIGYPKNKEREINYTLIIPTLNENIPESIVVCSNGKYGLINLETGKEIISCSLEGIYSATENETVYYIAEDQKTKVFLQTYIDNLNRVTVNLD